MQSDGDLVKAVLAGQREAFGILIGRYEKSVRAIGYSVLGVRDGVDDATQDAFVRAYEKLGTLRKQNSFGPWLLKIARRCALDAAGKNKQVQLLEYQNTVDSNNGQLSEDKEQLLAAVMRLAAGQRQAVMLRYFQGHSVSEVAEITGTSSGTITKQLSRAHRRLRILLREYEDEY